MLRLDFRPGIDRESTNYGNSGGWYDCDKIRFRDGKPETIKGWQRFSNDAMLGTPRSLFAWETIQGSQLYSAGTNVKYYIISGGNPNDITPIRRAVNLSTDPVTTTSGSADVVIADMSHGSTVGSYVTLAGLTAVNGVPASELNTEHLITDVASDGNSYTITVATSATASGAGGGASGTANYDILPGLTVAVFGAGWGTGAWSRGTWGSATDTGVQTANLRIWHHDNFGEDLLFNVRDGGLYFKDLSGSLSTRAVAVADEAGASDVPNLVRQVLVSDTTRQVIAFGASPQGETDLDKLLIRWSDNEDRLEWAPTDLNNAGFLRLNSGSEIVVAVPTSRETVVFTDVSVHSFRFIGDPFIYGQNSVGGNVSIAGPMAAIVANDTVFWMGRGAFYIYDGRVQELPCDIKDYVFQRLNTDQIEKVAGGLNRTFSEVTWFMPVDGAMENNFYVTYNFKEKAWYYGFLPRTAWLDARFTTNPFALAPDGYLYEHEVGNTDGSQNPPVLIPSYIESSDFEIGDGDRFMYIRRMLHDFTFFGSDNLGSSQLQVSLSARAYQGIEYRDEQQGNVTGTASVPIDQFTNRSDLRLRGRYIRLRIDSTTAGTRWRMGVPKLEIKPDGRR